MGDQEHVMTFWFILKSLPISGSSILHLPSGFISPPTKSWENMCEVEHFLKAYLVAIVLTILNFQSVDNFYQIKREWDRNR